MTKTSAPAPDLGFAADLRQMMSTWDTIHNAARAAYPGASENEIFVITAAAMDRSLGMGAQSTPRR